LIYRTFACLNRNCLHEFTVTDQEAAPCPRCSGARTKWVPRTTGVISGKTRQADQAVRELRDAYGDKNYNSPRIGQRAEPRHNPVVVPGKGRKFAPAANPTWATELPTTSDGKLYDGAYCGTTGVTAKVSHGVGNSAAAIPVAKNSASRTGAIPKFEASHRPKQ